MVLVTDIASNLTCAIFNYEKVEWAASTEFGGNSQTGLSNTRAAKVKIFLIIFKKIKILLSNFSGKRLVLIEEMEQNSLKFFLTVTIQE